MPALRLLLLFIWFYSIFFLLFVYGDATPAAAGAAASDPEDLDDNSSGVVFEMHHRHSASLGAESNNFGPPPKNRIDRTRQLLDSDNVRREMLSSHRIRLKTKQPAAWIPVHSGSDSGQGQYFVSLRVGSPHPQKVILVTDTGSDLTWMNCQYSCKDCPKAGPHVGRIYKASESTTFKTIPCSSDMCKVQLANFFSLNRCPQPDTPCLFDYRYLSGREAIGVFANDTLTVGLHNRFKVRLHDVLIGCTRGYNGSEGFPDGVLGLGYRNHSLAVRLANTFGSKFSYCLVDHLSASNLKNYLSFGDIPLSEKPKMEYTKLILGVISSFYAIDISGISLGNKRLNIPPEIWDAKGEGGMIIDSGTSLTMLAGAAYDEIVDTLRPVFNKFEKIKKEDELNLPEFELCFGPKGYNSSMVPKLVFHFVDGSKFAPPIDSYIIDVADGVKCLGIVHLTWPGTSVLGNIMQQSHFWEFDIGNRKLGFGPSTCVLSSESPKSGH
ncbi:aspartic proteinase NANA, chloroplast [Euphorbia lathyris]|uniref:aspartic proteinase NANA, chloroplast n=1 Tax=Euphorbia lathyris TaxID=212925 RepID=UPI0033140E60